MVDVSSSLYSQVQKAKGSFNENSLVNFLTQQSQVTASDDLLHFFEQYFFILNKMSLK